MKKQAIYALYKGDTFLNVGTAKELAEWWGVAVNTILFYCHSKRCKRIKGLYVTRLEEDEE